MTHTLCAHMNQTNKQKKGKRCPDQSCPGLFPVGGGEEGNKCERVNIVQILYTHICKWKNDTC
jgi:hypothetical protein